MKFLRELFTPREAADFKAPAPAPVPEAVLPQNPAGEIFDYIQAQKDIVTLKGLGTGQVKLPSTDRTITVYLVPTIDDYTRIQFTERGFSQTEMEGIITLTEREPQRSYKNIAIDGSGNMHVVERRPDDSFGPTEVTPEELDAIEKVATLSAIPGRIVDQFGSAAAFEAQISGKDREDVFRLMGSYEGLGIYNFGLPQYLEGVSRMRQGKMDQSTSGLRAVSMGSDDESVYFEKIIKKVAAAKKIT